MINSIRLQNFRSYRDASFEFDPNVNIIVGPNASGKTNLLEAVMVLAQGTSFRAKDADLIMFKKPWARLDGFFDAHERTVKIELNSPTPSKSHIVDERLFKRLSLDRTVPIVFFEPNHLQLMTRGPEFRRDYFDNLLSATIPTYKKLVYDYRRSLAQRNALLKKGYPTAMNQVFAWNVRLGELGSQIVVARNNLTEDINKDIPKKYSHIAGRKTKLSLEYVTSFPVENYASKLVSKLESSLQKDIDRGFTAYGPHRDDFIFHLDSQLANATASRGETRSILLSLKTIELEMVEKTRDQKPIFLLDDVFSELDGRRRQTLVELLENVQSIITTTDADAAVEYFSDNYRLIPLS